jgi:FtsP/CotA-like multicopper oxidase with cupredoxin domain
MMDRRTFLKVGTVAAAVGGRPTTASSSEPRADYTIRIGTGLIELAPDRVVSTTTYNGQFPGPLLRFREGQPVTVDVENQTDTAEQLHWHGLTVSADVDGTAEEGTPYIPVHGVRRIAFSPGPAGFRFYHTHLRAGKNLHRGQYSGQVGPVYIEPKREPGVYDGEVFLVLKEFQPFLSGAGETEPDVLATATRIKALEEAGEAATCSYTWTSASWPCSTVPEAVVPPVDLRAVEPADFRARLTAEIGRLPETQELLLPLPSGEIQRVVPVLTLPVGR